MQSNPAQGAALERYALCQNLCQTKKYTAIKKITALIVTAFIIQFNAFSQPCLPDGIEFTTQEQIDSFQINYPDCTEIEGNVMIYGDSIDNLSGLSVLIGISSDVFISCSNLIDLEGLNNITFIGGSLTLQGMDALLYLNGFENLITIEGNLAFGASETGGPDALINFEGFNNLEEIGGVLSIAGCNSLTSLTGLEGVSELHGLYIGNNPVLPNLTGLNNISTIIGNTNISNNEVLQNFIGLENLNSINGNLNIGDYGQMAGPSPGNPSLISLDGLDNLLSVSGDLCLIGNDNLVDLSGLNNLISIGGSLDVIFNNSLINLSGFENLSSINGRLKIGYDYWNEPYGNQSLTSLTGIENIEEGSINELYICWNSSLTECEVKSVCDYLASAGAEIEIHDNSAGCNTLLEVQEACESSDIYEYAKEMEISIFPNPAIDFITVKSKSDVQLKSLCILNQLGQKVLNKHKTNEEIDISTLDQGIYIVELEFDELMARKKLIIN